MVTRDSLIENLAFFNVQISDKSKSASLLDTIQSVCLDNKMSELDFANNWIAFSMNNDNVDLTEESLHLFQTDLTTSTKRKSNIDGNKENLTSPKAAKLLFEKINANESDSTLNNSLLSMYGSPDISKTAPAKLLTPLRPKPSQKDLSQIFGSPSSQQTKAQTPSKALDNKAKPVNYVQASRTFTSDTDEIVQNVLKKHHTTPCPRPFCKYPWQKLINADNYNGLYMRNQTSKTVINYLDSRIEHYINQIVGKKNYQNYEFSDVTDVAQSATYIGMIVTGNFEKITEQNAYFLGSQKSSRNCSVKLSIENLHKYTIYPGKVCILKGRNPDGNCIFPSEIIEDTISAIETANENEAQALKMMVACGPYNKTDSTDDYAHLNDLLSSIIGRDFKTCVLLGPFTDNKIDENTDSGRGQFLILCKSLNKFGVKNNVNFILIPSIGDRFAYPIYPQPSFNIFNDGIDFSHVKIFTNPCSISISGFSVTCNTVDSLIGLATSEYSKNSSSESKIDRLLAEIECQKCFYPSVSKRDSNIIDLNAASQFLMISRSPDLFIQSSNLKCFVKNINGSLFVNPGSVCKGKSVGTYSEVTLFRSPKDGKVVHDIKILNI